ncbi:MAG TPA: substrate-binding domain-containing protein [Lachnospiraceae bacterium]|nr:substrate-binding domain-containing protein [Lachnospiraceae bacterium]
MKKSMKSRFALWLLVIIVLLCLGALLVIQIKYRNLIQNHSIVSTDRKEVEYKYHCAFITQDYEDPFWNSIYEGAKEEGEKKSIYVENYGQKLSLNYSIDERIRMAMAASVDAIIIEGTDDVSTTELINQAVDQGIVVVTAYQDQMQSKRRSFVGVNKFTVGYNLCREAYECLNNVNDEIMVLYDKSSEINPDNVILNSGIKKFLDERYSKAELNAQYIDSTETYNTEEAIRELLRNASTRPRVLICTNLLQTQCAYQTVVDLNCVGDIKILGFYSTQSILEAIDKGVIEATLLVDTYQLGVEATSSVAEFLEVGYVSDYVAVDTTIVDKTKARELLRKELEESTIKNP